MAADRRGHYSHGFKRLGGYVRDIQSKACFPNAQPTVVRETVSAALVDGNAGFGAVVGQFSMELAMKKAKETGVGWVTARNSNHFGIAGYYTAMAEKQGLVGLACTNGTPWVAASEFSRQIQLLSRRLERKMACVLIWPLLRLQLAKLKWQLFVGRKSQQAGPSTGRAETPLIPKKL